MARKKKQTVKLYAVGWRRTAPDETTVEPFMVEVEAIENEASYAVLKDRWFGESAGYEGGKSFRYASRLLKIDREEWGIGLTPKEALNLAFAAEAKRREKANEELADIERSVSALLKLELKEVRA